MKKILFLFLFLLLPILFFGGTGPKSENEDNCSQEVEIPDESYTGYGDLHVLEIANDLIIAPNKTFELQTVKAVILTEVGSTYSGVKFHYYADNGNKPGELLGESNVLEPTEKILIEVLQGNFERTEITVDLDNPHVFLGDTSETTVWISITLEGYSGDGSYLEVTPDLHGTNEVYLYDDQWMSGIDLFNDETDGVISFYGECNDLEVCTGQPEAGQILEDSSFGVCPETAFTLTVTGTSATSGISMQWQQSLDEGETWTDIAGATSSALQLEDGITEPTSFRLEVTCEDSGLSDVTDPVLATINTLEECLCIPVFGSGCDSGDMIDSFTLNGENDTAIEDLDTGCSSDSYEDHTDMSVDLTQGGTYTATITGPGDPDDAIAIWIDFNDDGQFDQSERVVLQAGVNPEDSNEVNIEIPADAALGSHRMRVMVTWAWVVIVDPEDITPCNEKGSFSYGETHDYSINIIEKNQGGGDEDFPFPYCDITDPMIEVEEITLVEFGETTIVNENNSDVMVDKTSTIIDAERGQTYTISVEGVTYGDFDNTIVAFIDWDQNTVLDDEGEVYPVGIITNSTGDDGVSASVEITIPEDAILGETRVRITKVYGDENSPAITDPCNISMDAMGMGAFASYGQSLDFTLNIVKEMGVDASEFAGFHYYPNPMDQEMILKANSPIENLEVYNLIGQRVISLNPNAMETTFDGSKLESGVYLMRVTINGAQKSFKIVKK